MAKGTTNDKTNDTPETIRGMTKEDVISALRVLLAQDNKRRAYGKAYRKANPLSEAQKVERRDYAKVYAAKQRDYRNAILKMAAEFGITEI